MSVEPSFEAPDGLPVPQGLAAEAAARIVREGAADYFAGCRARVRPFVDANFSVAGSARLHRHALGWDLLKAPANVMLSVPQVGLKLGALAARGLGARGTAARLGGVDLFLDTAVARELRWRMMTDLLRQPYREGGREARADGLAEAILARPEMAALIAAAGASAAAHRDDAAFRARLEGALTDYTGARAAAAEITTGLIALGGGAVAFQKLTPGALALGPAIAASLAHGAAVSSFPLGAAAGGVWYALFPAAASPALVAGATAGVMGVAALAAAFAGLIADPAQRALGLHERRLNALIDALEAGFEGRDRAFVAYDLYVARLLDLSDMLLGVARAFRP
ncbi:DUF6635 family protein [Amaricoccus sp.]|uniref:DUF6635 family protein n=1 Tax=Amaricoccus sp. TaxID=1872485 RepID=UPI0025BEE71B|nr:DUF6635 family protein [Amaricoccus sp.]